MSAWLHFLHEVKLSVPFAVMKQNKAKNAFDILNTTFHSEEGLWSVLSKLL